MNLHLYAIGTKMPAWVELGFAEYQKRLSSHWPLTLHALGTSRRANNMNVEKVKELESNKLLEARPKGAYTIALDEHGTLYNTETLAKRALQWQTLSQNIAILIGGPDGLSASCLKACHERWSLSPLTLPHTLVRVILAEQLYRAFTLTSGHPYHRT